MEENNKINMPTLAAAIAYTNSHGGGGGGGTSNYNDLSNKPQIGGTTLTGNKSASDLGLVAAVDGKGLSTNDYTDADKAIVGGVTAALADKVDKVEGKGLSTNDFTDAYKTAIGDNTTAISGIKDGASINSFGGVETALADKADKSAVKNEFIGTTAEWNALTTAQKKAYDTYQITDDYTAGSGGLPDYSTTEQLTGQKWIDGKDIYFRTWDFESDLEVAYNSWTNTTILSNTFEKIIDYNAVSSYGANRALEVAIDGTYVQLTAVRNQGNTIVRYLTLYYTKA